MEEEHLFITKKSGKFVRFFCVCVCGGGGDGGRKNVPKTGWKIV